MLDPSSKFWYHASRSGGLMLNSKWVAALRLVGVGFYIGICILGGVLFGLWLDGKLKMKPLFMIAGLIFGLILAAYGVYQMLRPLINDRGNKENN
jgi:F0F1-type ATP synthase assembly protein I